MLFMNLLSHEKARSIVRAYPFKLGGSELKKFLSLFLNKKDSVDITTVDDDLNLSLKNYETNTRIFWWFEEVEAALQFFIRRFLPVGGNVLDVGASSGIIGLLAARLKGAQVKLVEANPDHITILTETLRINPKLSSLCQLIGRPCALGGTDERFKDSPGITIEQIILDAGWDKVQLLKVDVDGPDFEVLSSAGAFLRPQFIESIFIETETARPEDILRIAELGYTPYLTKRTHLPNLRHLWINQTERTHFNALDLKTLTQQNMPSNVLFVDSKGALNKHLERWCA